MMHEWKEEIPENENIILIHDRSSNMSKEKDFWDILVSPDVQPKLVGYGRRMMSYPLRIERTDCRVSRFFRPSRHVS